MATIFGMALGGWMSGVIFDLTGSYRTAFLNGIAWNVLQPRHRRLAVPAAARPDCQPRNRRRLIPGRSPDRFAGRVCPRPCFPLYARSRPQTPLEARARRLSPDSHVNGAAPSGGLSVSKG